MSFLHDFLIEERSLVVTLPIRVAFWMSHADDMKGTERDSEREIMAVEKACRKIVRKTGDAAFTNDVIEAALVDRAEWSRWQNEDEGSLFSAIEKALFLVDDRLPDKAALSYRKILYYIAVVVAQAANEEAGDDFRKEIMGGTFMTWVIDKLTVADDMKTPENVSDKEKAALARLKAALKK